MSIKTLLEEFFWDLFALELIKNFVGSIFKPMRHCSGIVASKQHSNITDDQPYLEAPLWLRLDRHIALIECRHPDDDNSTGGGNYLRDRMLLATVVQFHLSLNSAFVKCTSNRYWLAD